MSNDEGFVMFEGSVGPRRTCDSIGDGWKRLRESLVEEDSVVVDGEILRFAEDVLFKSPSAAAAIVCGGSRNGRQAWKDENGTALADLEQALLDHDDDENEDFVDAAERGLGQSAAGELVDDCE